MTIETQTRPPLSGAVQQAAAATLASIVALQIANFDAADSLPAEKDFAICDASGGAFNLALPSSAEAIVGKPYIVKEVDGTNAVTLTTPGSETIDGGATFIVAAGTSACVIWDGTTWTSVANAGSGGAGFLPDAAGSVDATNLAADSVTTVKILNANVTTAKIADANVTPVKLSSGYRPVASDGAVVLAAADRTIELLASAAGAKAVTMTATHAGHVVRLQLLARSGGSYTAAASGLTVTLDAAGEGVDLVYDGAAWRIAGLLGGATAA